MREVGGIGEDGGSGRGIRISFILSKRALSDFQAMAQAGIL